MNITQKMIGSLDLLELNICEVDQVAPAIIDIQAALNAYPNLHSNNECKVKINRWVEMLKQKNAADRLNDDEIRQLKYDLDSSFMSFKQILDNK